MKKDSRYKIIIGLLSLLIVMQWLFIFSRPKKPPEVLKPQPKVKGQIAIVLDDWGYNLKNLSQAKEIKYPITISVLPNLAYSQRISEQFYAWGQEVILHLPLEPEENLRLEKNTITTSMPEAAIKETLSKCLLSVPRIKGVSNHMGSKATRHRRTMEIILKELKKRKLYFLDSYVSAHSVCSEIADDLKIDYARRDIFLDNYPDIAYITGQLRKLKNRAALYGQAIGIGHDRPSTLAALKEKMPEIESEGYKFVFVSELVK